MAHLHRSSSRRTSSFHSTWCCSFSVPPASPEPAFLSKPSPALTKLGRRIVSPGRVSPIPLPDPPPPEPDTDTDVSVRSEDRGSGDLRLRLRDRDMRFLVLEIDSAVICENSEVLEKLVKESGNGEVEVGEVEDLGAFREMIEMMYVEEEEEVLRMLARAGVARSIDLLEVSSKIMFDRGVSSCLNYIESVPWSEHEEEKLKALFARCSFDEAVTQDILARLHCVTIGTENLAVHLIQSIVDGANNTARKELQSLVTGLMSYSSIYQKDPAGLNKDRLYSICHSCLDSLMALFDEAIDCSYVNGAGASKTTKPLVERISKQVENLNWLLEILLNRHMAEDFVRLWADQKELINMHKATSPMVRYELSRISANVFIAMGKGKLRCPGDVRFSVLEAWFEPMLFDFGWLQRCSKGLDIRLLEEGLGQALLTLPLKQQHIFFVEWFRCFGRKGTECPNLTNAFEVWWRRSFVRMSESRS